MSHIELEDLNKVNLICETEQDKIEADIFLKERHLNIGMKTFILIGDIEDLELNININYGILENDNPEFSKKMFDYFIKINLKTVIIKIK